MIKNTYRIKGPVEKLADFRALLKSNFIKFTTRILSFGGKVYFVDISINISDDMVKEVDELVKECAEKTGVRVV